MNTNKLTLVRSTNQNNQEILRYITNTNVEMVVKFALIQAVLSHPDRTADDWEKYMDIIAVLIDDIDSLRLLKDIILADLIAANVYDNTKIDTIVNAMIDEYDNENDSEKPILCYHVNILSHKKITIRELEMATMPFPTVFERYHSFLLSCGDAELLLKLQQKKFDLVADVSCIISNYFHANIFGDICWLGVYMINVLNEEKILQVINKTAAAHHKIMRGNTNKSNFINNVVTKKLLKIYKCSGGNENVNTADIFEKAGPITYSEKNQKNRSQYSKFCGLGYKEQKKVMFYFYIILHYFTTVIIKRSNRHGSMQFRLSTNKLPTSLNKKNKLQNSRNKKQEYRLNEEVLVFSVTHNCWMNAKIIDKLNNNRLKVEYGDRTKKLDANSCYIKHKTV